MGELEPEMSTDGCSQAGGWDSRIGAGLAFPLSFMVVEEAEEGYPKRGASSAPWWCTWDIWRVHEQIVLSVRLPDKQTLLSYSP